MTKNASVVVVTTCVLSVLFLYNVSGFLWSARILSSQGSVFIPEIFYVKPFGFRIADMMVDLLRPDFDDQWYSTYWQAALDDLVSASSNGEITHAQLRIFWRVDPNNRSTWEYPELGSNDPSQQIVMDNWKRWLFGVGDPPLAHGPSAMERIRSAGSKLELCMSASWNPGTGTLADVIPVWYWGGREADYNFDGELFLDNYFNNVLLPVVNFVKDYLEDGDIFMLAFEMVYPTADFTWSHNAKWVSIIDTVRSIFRSAGKSIVLTIDHSNWYNDFGLGYNAVKLLKPDAPITSESPGISGASYLGELDFISLSHWLPVILPSEVPATWSDSDIPWVTDGWFNNKNFFKVGTGYGGVSGELGRDFIADFRALSTIMGKKVLMNSGWENNHGDIARARTGITDNEEQRISWAAHLAAIGDPRSNFTAWCAGQDFERYCRDKTAYPDYINTSWRKASAESAIIEGIRAIINTT